MKQQKKTSKKKKTRKAVALHVDKNKIELDRLCPMRECYVCERTSRDLLRIGPTKFRHQDCNPGSTNWLDYYERLHPTQKTIAGILLYEHARK
jgi:hypothetical protein